MKELQAGHAGHTAEVLDGLVRDADRAGVVAGPEVQTLFDVHGDAQGHAVALARAAGNTWRSS